MTGDEYMALLTRRRDQWAAEHPRDPRAKAWVEPLLEWFVLPGDAALFTPPATSTTPATTSRKPRTYRTAASLRAERDRLQSRADQLTAPLLPDRAAAGGVALGARRTAANAAAEDRRLAEYVTLTQRIDDLNTRIARAEAREASR